MKIGRYRIFFGEYGWVQTQLPFTIRHFLFFTIIKEAHPLDVSKKPQFIPGTRMENEGRVFRYMKASEDIKVGEGIYRTEE